MLERATLVVDLYRELVGPRGGPDEVLPITHSPRDEYMCGVLEPSSAGGDPANIEAEADLPSEEIEPSLDDQGAEPVQVTGSMVLSPALDPKALPRSIGLSFFVTGGGGDPVIQVCATWARYIQDAQGWARSPTALVTPLFAATGHAVFRSADHVGVHVRATRIDGARWRVALFLVNEVPPRDRDRVEVSELVFQPQIRVVCGEGTSIVPAGDYVSAVNVLESDTSAGNDDPSTSLHYANRRAFARGHLCGAIWRDIDPERPHPSLPLPSAAPFKWTDCDAVPPEERAKFQCPAVRTELMPIYPVQAPDMEWSEEFGLPPLLDPGALAECWNAADLRSALEPLPDGYGRWIADLRAGLPAIPEAEREILERNLSVCDDACARIRRGIALLCSDEDVRLAFCFANKAISVQAAWKSQALQWRPFQLAFILLNVPALADTASPDRGLCDLLWIATGGGKTEAYLGLMAFCIALRRRRSKRGVRSFGLQGAGVAVLSRYTLRLLTIQQFRRAMGLVAACDLLRVQGLDRAGGLVGWRPRQYPGSETFLWGGMRFAAGLWVGGGVTPNRLFSIGPMPPPGGGRFIYLAGAIDILQGIRPNYQGPNTRLQQAARAARIERDGEPAQLTSCPCCGAILAVSEDGGLQSGNHTLHWVFEASSPTTPAVSSLSAAGLTATVAGVRLHSHGRNIHTLSVDISVAPNAALTGWDLEEWWYRTVGPAISGSARLLCASPQRLGYFIQTFDNSGHVGRQSDFEIFCANPVCELNSHAWAEQVPLPRNGQAPRAGAGAVSMGLPASQSRAALPSDPGTSWQAVFPAFQADSPLVSSRIPISALTVDDQLYHRCPSVVVATVDKFARLPFEAKASALFGNVDHFHSRWGYYREGCPVHGNGPLPGAFRRHPSGAVGRRSLHVPVAGFRAPDLILQDELHLIEGPLGSMVGLYESSIDVLCRSAGEQRATIPKYVASTATVREAASQVESLFARTLAQFPPPARSADERFFARDEEVHPLDVARPGRLYVGVCAPGRGAQTPIVRIWSALLQTAYELWHANPSSVTDQFFSLVGYFNAIRELAGASSLYRQDIPERLLFRWGNAARPLDDTVVELSGRTKSLDLPALLERLGEAAPDAPVGVFSTSMFGTGVDVTRLGLMVVHGQPKTTASYIQASGRVGRRAGGLVVSFFRASRPRDLDHYEFFTGYHRALHRYVEPVTVAPFSPRARERGLGPLGVVLLRHAGAIRGHPVHPDWRVQERLSGGYHAEARRMGAHRHDAEVAGIPMVLEVRSQLQSPGRRPPTGVTSTEAASELDRWAAIARRHTSPDAFVYYEYGFVRIPQRDVVLGDAQHLAQGLQEAFHSTPQSLRDVEETTGFKS